ncbi:MAG TPA: ATP-binding protein [Solirubrobacteraceae bacterium]|nr:ATP-binding protein [Solirubrobacteraceae bacterium]
MNPTAPGAAAGMAARLRHPRTTVRWRLTLLYGGLFLVCGAALLAITYTLVDHATVTNGPFRAFVNATRPPPSASRPSFERAPIGQVAHPPKSGLPGEIQKLLKTRSGQRAIFTVGSVQRISDLHQLVIESSIALAIMAIISGALGWMVAGRVLAPLRTMTAATQQMSEANLHERLAMTGPPDELRQLADTIDGLLGRLEGAFDAQRRFVANASHELRTPLTTVRALLEMVLSDPRATVRTFRTTCRQVLEESEQQEQLIDALLALAQGQRGIDARERIDLAAIAGEVVGAHEGQAAARGVHIDASLETAAIAGDRRLIERLVSNLVDNALRYNQPGGTARVEVRPGAGEVELAVANTGPAVPAEEIGRLLQPFQRLAGDRVGHREGLGLGLSVVAAIANAHDAPLDVRPGAHGGLDITVRFARAPAPAPPEDSAQSDPPAVGLGIVET